MLFFVLGFRYLYCFMLVNLNVVGNNSIYFERIENLLREEVMISLVG